MRLVNSEKLSQLQKNPVNVRNICILAHVDHGKTTLADSLVASNGIISQRLAGKLRYLDSRKDEQERGITMKSSSISLYHSVKNEEEEEYLINLIDSPGHVDFSSEVSTAVRLCDGALVVVDVVEGVCAQTIAVLRQAWQENIRPVLVLNKIDRLILEMKFCPLDAYVHLTQVLEKVNVVMAELLTSEIMGKDAEEDEDKKQKDSKESDMKEYYDWSTGLDDMDDSNLYFSPDQGNVIFASAADGWGFRVEDFARIYAEKVGVRQEVLNKTLWGDYYLNAKHKRIMKKAQEKVKKPLFVQLVLDNLWALYEVIAVRKDRLALEKMVTNLGLNIPARSLKQNDLKLVLQSVMSAWLPLSKTVLDMVCQKLPSPLELSEARVERLMLSRHKSFASLPAECQDLKKFFLTCDSSDTAPVIVFVSKMFAVERNVLPENRPKALTAEEIAARRDQARLRLAEKLARPDVQAEACVPVPEASEKEEIKVEEPEWVNTDAFIAFARVYSGTLKKNSKLCILGPRYDPATAPELQSDNIEIPTSLKDLKPGHHVTLADIKHLYMLMGRELEALDEVPAGNILGIGGLEDHILKTATISSTLACPAFIDLNLMAVPILRVALEPAHPADINKLVQGLKFLNQADPCVQIMIQDTGEHVLVTAGEVHLQRCLDDLKERFCKIEIHASKPIVPFRETIIEPPKVDMVNEAIYTQQSSKSTQSNAQKSGGDDKNSEADGGLITLMTPNKKCTIKIRASPLPAEVTTFLDESSELIKILKDRDRDNISGGKGQESISSEVISDLQEFRQKLQALFKEANWDPAIVDRIWSFGPKKCGPNVLINQIPSYERGCAWPRQVLSSDSSAACEQKENPLYAYDSNFVNGFQLATLAGPLCEEPMMGVAFIVEEWSLNEQGADGDAESTSSLPYGPFSGQIMSAVRDSCRKAFQAQPQRLMVAMYSCSIQVNAEVLGKLYAVLGKRGGRILHGDLQEGSTMFEVTALLPVVESFDFANEVRRQTSGLALPQLVFSGWEVLEIDPFWQPTTEEEYLHFGEKADTENRARKYMNAVRKRKGLRVEEKTVQFAEKQRTLTRNK